jgi:hypothetical protein
MFHCHSSGSEIASTQRGGRTLYAMSKNPGAVDILFGQHRAQVYDAIGKFRTKRDEKFAKQGLFIATADQSGRQIKRWQMLGQQLLVAVRYLLRLL